MDRAKHRDAFRGEYSAWCNMKARCDNPNHPSYDRYGARGISVCSEWADFDNFIRDMGQRPSNGHTLDRENNDLGYSKSNCRWVTRKVQQGNRGDYNLWVSFRGKSTVLQNVADALGLSSQRLKRLLLKGYTITEVERGIEQGADFKNWKTKFVLCEDDVFSKNTCT